MLCSRKHFIDGNRTVSSTDSVALVNYPFQYQTHLKLKLKQCTCLFNDFIIKTVVSSFWHYYWKSVSNSPKSTVCKRTSFFEWKLYWNSIHLHININRTILIHFHVHCYHFKKAIDNCPKSKTKYGCLFWFDPTSNDKEHLDLPGIMLYLHSIQIISSHVSWVKKKIMLQFYPKNRGEIHFSHIRFTCFYNSLNIDFEHFFTSTKLQWNFSRTYTIFKWDTVVRTFFFLLWFF